MIRLTPAFRISISLTILTLSLLLTADLFGLLPNRNSLALDARKKFSEALAVQLSTVIQRRDLAGIRATLEAVVERNNDVLSAALRTADGTLAVTAGDHNQHWQQKTSDLSSPIQTLVPIFKVETESKPETERSTTDQARLPIYRDGSRWGTVEVRFEKLPLSHFYHPELFTFIAVVGFAAYFLFTRRVLRFLDPSSVVPVRVKTTLDALAEGVLLLDDEQRIVLANAAFTKNTGYPVDQLLGQSASALSWLNGQSDQPIDPQYLPWQTDSNGDSRLGVPLGLTTGTGDKRLFMVNSTPILGHDNRPRGMLATFDDVTEIEHKNRQLQEIVQALKVSQEEIAQKNSELEVLATRDPLTGCLNRRSLMEQLRVLFQNAQGKVDSNFACVMADIDHFKAVNDTHGHAVGDEVIKIVARIFQDCASTDDLVYRYGGEEFCILLPHTNLAGAVAYAEQCRQTIAAGSEAIPFRFSASFGTSSLLSGRPVDHQDLLSQADQALYTAKQNGRNRVVKWQPASNSAETSQQAAR